MHKYCLLLSLITLALCGCDKDKIADENLRIPRLMVESRGADYGGLGSTVKKMPVSGTRITLNKEPLVNEFDIINVELVKVDLGLALLIQANQKGSRELYRGTVSNMGGRIVLTVNNNPIGARRIDQAIMDGNFYTFVELPDEDLPELVLNMKETIRELQKKAAL